MNGNPAGQQGQQGHPGQPPAPNGARPGHPPGQPPKRPLPAALRRRRPADPLVARKKPQHRPKSTYADKVARNTGEGFNLPPEARTLTEKNPQEEARKLAAFEAQRKQNGGWTDAAPPAGMYRDFPVVTTKRALREGIRYHVMRFAKAGKGGDDDAEIDPTDQDEFTRPVSLHRRDPRQPAPGRANKDGPGAGAAGGAGGAGGGEGEGGDEKAGGAGEQSVDEKEAERLAQIKADRENQRAMDMAQIAPVARGDGTTKKPAAPNHKKEKQFQVYFPKTSTEQKKESEIRYEEALPWHLEDADGKNVWVGSYVSALSEANIALVVDGSRFRMVPLEKFYRFTPKPPFQAYSIDEVEEIMAKKMAVGRWAMREGEKKKLEDELAETRRMIGGRARVKLESSTFRSAPRSEKVDHDDIDMEGDEFQDDDETVGFEPENDEDSKDARERQRRNHLGANLFGDADEREVDKEEEEDRAAKKTRQLGKQLRKALAKREDHLEYLEYVDSDTNSEKEDFLDLSSDDDDDEKNDEDKKDKDKEKEKEKEKSSSNNTPKGNTTPQGKKSEAAKSKKSLKRPGSPNLSESSGNESSRKKPKKKHGGSVRPSRSTTPMPGGQVGRPKKSATTAAAAAAAAAAAGAAASAQSDGEATGGEMSDAGSGAKRRIKIVARSTPVGSRAGSPVPGPSSRPGSPARAASPPANGNGNGNGNGQIDAAEIINTLMQIPEGVTVGGLLRRFGSRIGDGPNQMRRKDWIRLVKENAVFGEDKLLRPKAGGAAAGGEGAPAE